LFEEDERKAAELENQKREKKDAPLVEDKTYDQNRKEKIKKEEKEDKNKDEPIGEEESEDEKAEEFLMELRDTKDELDGVDKDVENGQEHLEVE